MLSKLRLKLKLTRVNESITPSRIKKKIIKRKVV